MVSIPWLALALLSPWPCAEQAIRPTSTAAGPQDEATSTDAPYLAAAREAASWLESVAMETSGGRTWPTALEDGRTDDLSLYAGAPGPILFLLELYHATGEEDYRRRARAGAEALLAASRHSAVEPGDGLYTGAAGIGFTFAETARATGDESLLEACLLYTSDAADE